MEKRAAAKKKAMLRTCPSVWIQAIPCSPSFIRVHRVHRVHHMHAGDGQTAKLVMGERASTAVVMTMTVSVMVTMAARSGL
jgi:hypothetical protein